MTEWRVLIVEDDPHVAVVHERVVRQMPMFKVVGRTESAEQTMGVLPSLCPHLLLLDLTLPGADGLTLARNLRNRAHPVEVIAVTATRNSEVVRAMVHLGVVDYLVKPFSPDRMRQALGFFLRRMAAMEHGSLGQAEVDALCASGRRVGRWLPKGLVAEKLEEVRRHLDDTPGGISAEQVGEAAGMARVTARRYLEYLLTTQQVVVQLSSDGPGRPRRLYRTVGGTALAPAPSPRGSVPTSGPGSVAPARRR